MRRSLFLAAAALVAAVPAFAANPDRGPPPFCAGPDIPADVAPPPLPLPERLPGLYRCVDEGMTFTVRLGADGSAEQSFEVSDAIGWPEEDIDDMTLRVSGRWSLEDGRVMLRGHDQQRGEPVELEIHPLDGEGRAVAIPVGIGAAVLRRVEP